MSGLHGRFASAFAGENVLDHQFLLIKQAPGILQIFLGPGDLRIGAGELHIR
jgi:hypothetical protein